MILVVDHDPEFLDQAQKILNRDRQVFLASTAEQALDMVRRLSFSVVLVEIDLPGDGCALIRKLHRQNREQLIIGVQGAVQASAKTVSENLGVVEYLHKPVTAAWKSVVERIRARRSR